MSFILKDINLDIAVQNGENSFISIKYLLLLTSYPFYTGGYTRGYSDAIPHIFSKQEIEGVKELAKQSYLQILKSRLKNTQK